jgi:hypothetical protein
MIIERFLRESHALKEAAEHLRRYKSACRLHETIPAARAALLAALYRELGGQLIVVTPTADAAERTFTDLLCYLGQDKDESEGTRSVSLVRARDEGAGALENPSEQSAFRASYSYRSPPSGSTSLHRRHFVHRVRLYARVMRPAGKRHLRVCTNLGISVLTW